MDHKINAGPHAENPNALDNKFLPLHFRQGFEQADRRFGIMPLAIEREEVLEAPYVESNCEVQTTLRIYNSRLIPK